MIYTTIRIDSNKCDYCLECVENCPSTAISYFKACFTHFPDKCTNCESCEMLCPNEAITIISGDK